MDVGFHVGTGFWAPLPLRDLDPSDDFGVAEILTRADMMSSYDSHDQESSKPALQLSNPKRTSHPF